MCVCVCYTHTYSVGALGIGGNVSHTHVYTCTYAVGYGELKSNELYTFAMMDTRKGQPQATGILPSLLVLDYHVTNSKLKKNTCTLSCNMTPWQGYH